MRYPRPGGGSPELSLRLLRLTQRVRTDMASGRIHLGILGLGLALLLAGCSPQQADLSSAIDPRENVDKNSIDVFPTAVSGAVISTVTPTATLSATPTSGPALYELLRLRSYLRDTQSTLLELYQEIPKLPPGERAQLAQQLGELMAETSHFMAVIEQLIDRASPEDREAAVGSLQRLQADLQSIQRLANEGQAITNIDTTPTPAPLPESSPRMADLVLQMENVQQQVPPRLQQLSDQQLQAVVGSMADVIGDLDELIGYTSSTFSNLGMDQQEAFADRGEGIYDIVTRMEWTSGVETPSPWLSPMLP